MCPTICFTATLPNSKQMALEQRILDHLGMRTLTYASRDLMQAEQPLEVEGVEATTDEDFALFVLEKAQ